MHQEDRRAWEAVEPALDSIASAMELVAAAFRIGGRLIYVGAGTSGRLGVLDASECPPTFGVNPALVQASIAGGEVALSSAVEGAEDDVAAGSAVISERNVCGQDVLCGIAASGSTPYVRGALIAAKEAGAATVLITCNPDCSVAGVDVPIVLAVGPEVIAGSSRLKAGTATKMALNMITTGAMVRWGKVFDNLMVDLAPTNDKLRQRATRLVINLGRVDHDTARRVLDEADWNVRVAVVMARTHLDAAAAHGRLQAVGGFLRPAIDGTSGT